MVQQQCSGLARVAWHILNRPFGNSTTPKGSTHTNLNVYPYTDDQVKKGKGRKRTISLPHYENVTHERRRGVKLLYRYTIPIAIVKNIHPPIQATRLNSLAHVQLLLGLAVAKERHTRNDTLRPRTTNKKTQRKKKKSCSIAAAPSRTCSGPCQNKRRRKRSHSKHAFHVVVRGCDGGAARTTSKRGVNTRNIPETKPRCTESKRKAGRASV